MTRAIRLAESQKYDRNDPLSYDSDQEQDAQMNDTDMQDINTEALSMHLITRTARVSEANSCLVPLTLQNKRLLALVDTGANVSSLDLGVCK